MSDVQDPLKLPVVEILRSTWHLPFTLSDKLFPIFFCAHVAMLAISYFLILHVFPQSLLLSHLLVGPLIFWLLSAPLFVYIHRVLDQRSARSSFLRTTVTYAVALAVLLLLSGYVLLLANPFVPFAILMGLASPNVDSPMQIIILLIFLFGLSVYLVGRLALVLPSVAQGNPLLDRRAWRLTREHTVRLLGLVLVVGFVVFVLQFLVTNILLQILPEPAGNVPLKPGDPGWDPRDSEAIRNWLVPKPTPLVEFVMAATAILASYLRTVVILGVLTRSYSILSKQESD